MYLDYICLLDFEANCNENKTINPQEIIEFPAILIKLRGENNRPEEIGRFHTYVKPRVHPISQFCTNLTGITQDMVDRGKDIEIVLNDHYLWLKLFGLDPFNPTLYGYRFAYMSCGNWDLQTCLPNLALHFKIKYPLCLKIWLNIKREFMNFYSRPKPYDLHALLKEFDLEPHGKHHSGMDDTINITRILILMIKDGYKPEYRKKIYL